MARSVSPMSGQVASMSAAQAAATRNLDEARETILLKWGGHWGVSAWPPYTGDEDSDPDEPYLHAWAGSELFGHPHDVQGLEWSADVDLALSDNPAVVVIGARLLLWRQGLPALTLADVLKRAVAHDEGPSEAAAVAREISSILDRLLHEHAEPIE